MIFSDCFVASFFAMTIVGTDPILEPGPPGSWDDEWVLDGHVIIVNDTLKMWYLGVHANHDTFPFKGIGYAYSVDSGRTWQKYPGNPVFYADSNSGWEYTPTKHDGLWEAVVLYDGGEYKMWYQCMDSTDCYNTLFARSPDGINWSRGNNGKPVVYAGWHEDTSHNWDSRYAGARSVIKRDGLYYLFYEGESFDYLYEMSMGLAIGIDETTFTKVDTSNPIFTTRGTADTLWCGNSIIPNVILSGNKFILVYSSNSAHTRKTTVGLAVSEDGITWSRYSRNPICDLLKLGYPGGAITSVYWDIKESKVNELVAILRRIPLGIFSCELSFLLIRP